MESTAKVTIDDVRQLQDTKPLKRKIELIEEGIRDGDNAHVPHVRIEKAHGPMVPVVKWLLARTDEEKFAAVAAHILLDGDIEFSIKDQGLDAARR